MTVEDKKSSDKPSLRKRIDKIKKEDLNISTKNFIDSLSEYYDLKGHLTGRQVESLEKIESRFSPQEKEKLRIWTIEYREKYITDAKIIANYYLHSGYYQGISYKILNEDEFVPSESKLKKFLGNKYAQNVLKTHYEEPKYNVNDLVKIRKTAGSMMVDPHLIELRERACFILENNLPVKHAVKGGKRYSILPMGSSTVMECDERNLFTPKKKGKTK